jgi:predicted nucleic-acid-binding Zn-ribbon protein
MKSITKPICQTFRTISTTWSTNQKYSETQRRSTLKVDKVVDVEHVTETHILCRTCKQNFFSKNKLHLHLHRMSEAAQNSKPEPLKNTSTFIKFTAKEKTSRAMGLEVEDMPRL